MWWRPAEGYSNRYPPPCSLNWVEARGTWWKHTTAWPVTIHTPTWLAFIAANDREPWSW